MKSNKSLGFVIVIFLAIVVIMGMVIYDKSETVSLMKQVDELKISLDGSIFTSETLAKSLSAVNGLIIDNDTLIQQINNILTSTGYDSMIRVLPIKTESESKD